MAQQHLVLNVCSGALTTTYTETTSGYKYPIRLDKGHNWYIEDAYICAGTNVALDATNCLIWYLKDSSGNTIASLSHATTALTASGTTLASFSEAYRTINCASDAGYIYLSFTNSGTSMAPVNVSLHLVIQDRRPGVTAGEE